MRKVLGVISMFLLTLSYSCDEFSLVNELDGPGGINLTVSPAIYQMPVNDSVVITVEGGYPPYSFTILEGGGDIDAVTNTFVAPDTPGNVVIRVSDRAGSIVDMYISVTAAIIGNTGVDYSPESLSATGGTVTESPISGSFNIINNGAAAGNHEINWHMYAYAHPPAGGSDFLLASGTEGALSAQESTEVLFNAAWPAVRGTYYLVVRIDAPDDENTLNNESNTLTVTITDPPPSDVDYVVDTVTSSDNQVNAGTAVSGSFIYSNLGSIDGEDPVYWRAYISTDRQRDGGDTEVDSGEAPALLAGDTSGTIGINGGSWPADAGIYYLIVELTAPDEAAGWNNTLSSEAVSVYAAALDYIVTGVTQHYPTVMTGGTLSETFDLRNFGDTNGTQEVRWTAYASLDTTIDDPGDTIVDSGITTQLDAGATAAGIDVTGNWPAAGGNYYLIIEVSADDEAPAQEHNNTGYSGPFTVLDPPNYSVTAPAPTLPADSMVGTSFSGSFTISETSGNPGTRAIEYSVYLSSDEGIGNDLVVAREVLPPLDGNEEVNLSFEYPGWPDNSGGEYYIIIAIDADDDLNSSDDTYVSSRYVVYDIAESGMNNDDIGPTTSQLSNVDNLNILTRSETLVVQGNLDGAGTWDTYKFQLPGSALPTDTLRAQVIWETGSNALDLWFWDENNYESASVSTLPDEEPGIEEIGLPGGAARYYIGIKALENTGRYYLKITFEP